MFRFKNLPNWFYLLLVFLGPPLAYVFWVFFYLQIVGVYAVAVLKEGRSTSEGVDYKYEFYYEGKPYTGVFTGLGDQRIGDKYFVLFSRSDPDKNLLQYGSPVPDCLKNDSNKFWIKKPACP